MNRQRVPTGTEKTAQEVIYIEYAVALEQAQFAYISSPTEATGCCHISEIRRIWTPNQILQL